VCGAAALSAALCRCSRPWLLWPCRAESDPPKLAKFVAVRTTPLGEAAPPVGWESGWWKCAYGLCDGVEADGMGPLAEGGSMPCRALLCGAVGR
jgi:hypothetical protein